MPMATKRDYYEVLGVERHATEQEIARAYRKLAIQFHPDSNPGDDEATVRFKEAAEAYEVLSDVEKRSLYDRHGHAALGGAPGAGFTTSRTSSTPSAICSAERSVICLVAAAGGDGAAGECTAGTMCSAKSS